MRVCNNRRVLCRHAAPPAIHVIHLRLLLNSSSPAFPPRLSPSARLSTLLADVHTFANYSFRGCGFYMYSSNYRDSRLYWCQTVSPFFLRSSLTPFRFPPALVGSGTPQLHSASSLLPATMQEKGDSAGVPWECWEPFGCQRNRAPEQPVSRSSESQRRRRRLVREDWQEGRHACTCAHTHV